MSEDSPRVETRLTKWGNSQGVRIPKELCEKLGISVGDSLVIEYDSGVIRISTGRVRPRYHATKHIDLDELFAGFDGEYRGEERLGEPVGAEAWPPYDLPLPGDGGADARGVA